jgi:hypothetical protein
MDPDCSALTTSALTKDRNYLAQTFAALMTNMDHPASCLLHSSLCGLDEESILLQTAYFEFVDGFRLLPADHLGFDKNSHLRYNDFIGLDEGSQPHCTACPGLGDSESAGLPSEYPSTDDGSRLPRPAYVGIHVGL